SHAHLALGLHRLPPSPSPSPPPRSARPPALCLFPYTTLFRSGHVGKSRRGEVSVFADLWELAAKALRPLPVLHKELSEESRVRRSEEHTSELQSRGKLGCRLLLGKKNTRE